MSKRAEALANRIIEGAEALAAFAEGLDDRAWKTPVPMDGRTVGVVVHHVGFVYPIEVQLAETLASGQPITGVSWQDIHDMNRQHALDHAEVSKEEALRLLRKNAATAAAAVARMTDEELDRAQSVSLNGDAPLTAQFFIEDHALRHSFHHLAKIRAAVGTVQGVGVGQEGAPA